MMHYINRLSLIVCSLFMFDHAAIAKTGVVDFLAWADSHIDKAVAENYVLTQLAFVHKQNSNAENPDFAKQVYKRMNLNFFHRPFLKEDEFVALFSEALGDGNLEVCAVMVLMSKNVSQKTMTPDNRYDKVLLFDPVKLTYLGSFNVPTQSMISQEMRDASYGTLGKVFAQNISYALAFDQYISSAYNPMNAYFDYSNDISWDMRLYHNAIIYKFDSKRQQNGGFILGLDIQTGKIDFLSHLKY
jgi:hypothetical protein